MQVLLTKWIITGIDTEFAQRTPSLWISKNMYPEIEVELEPWVIERRENGYTIWRKDITEYAEALAAAEVVRKTLWFLMVG